MNRKGPFEGYGRQAKLVVSFPSSFARTFSSKERRLGTRQSLSGNYTITRDTFTAGNWRGACDQTFPR